MSSFAQNQAAIAQREISKWSDGYVEVWSYGRAHRWVKLRLAKEGRTGCLLVSFGDVERYCGPLHWLDSRITLRAESDPQTGDHIYIAADDSADFELRCGVVEHTVRQDEYPK